MDSSPPGKARLTGYFPGVIGKIVELHAVYYARHWGFDISFETQVGRELSEFMAGFDESRDGFWAALVGDEFAGAIAIDGRQSGQHGARLRWFIVDERFQGRGVGRLLMDEAMAFCRRVGQVRVHLWTFKGLEVARVLYERAGFRLHAEVPVEKWGNAITEQMYLYGPAEPTAQG